MKKKVIAFLILTVLFACIVYADNHVNNRAECKNCSCTYFKCVGDKMGVCYCSCGHSSKSHVFPNSYVQECKKLYDSAIKNIEYFEKEMEYYEKKAEKASSLAMQLEMSREAREWRKIAQEYLNILKQIE